MRANSTMQISHRLFIIEQYNFFYVRQKRQFGSEI